jgi:hypothetical protein
VGLCPGKSYDLHSVRTFECLVERAGVCKTIKTQSRYSTALRYPPAYTLPHSRMI